jgi:hypothetical protein
MLVPRVSQVSRKRFSDVMFGEIFLLSIIIPDGYKSLNLCKEITYLHSFIFLKGTEQKRLDHWITHHMDFSDVFLPSRPIYGSSWA